MDKNFNLSLLIIVNEPIELSDLFNRSNGINGVSLKLMAPETRLVGGSGITFAIGGGNPNFAFRGAVLGKDLIVFNMVYQNITRGIFQTQVPGTKDILAGNETFNALRDLVKQLGYSDIFAYEIGINLTIEHNEYPLYGKIKGLRTMKSPRLKAIKLLDGDTQGKDLREEYISEISIERITHQSGKSIVSTVYRTKEFEENALHDILSDIDEVVKLIR